MPPWYPHGGGFPKWGTPLHHPVRNDHDSVLKPTVTTGDPPFQETPVEWENYSLGMVRLYYIPMISPTYPYKVHVLIPIIYIYTHTYN